MKNIQLLAKRLGRNHELAAALWETGCYEARLLTAYVDDRALVTPTQMEDWCREFDNWAICDTLCFVLFDRTPHAAHRTPGPRLRSGARIVTSSRSARPLRYSLR